MKQTSRFRFWLISALIFFVTLWLLRGVLLPFVTGLILAYLLDPIADRLQRLHFSRLAATSIITAVFFLILIGVLVLLIPMLEHQITAFVSKIPDYARALAEWAQPLMRRLERMLSPADYARVKTSVAQYTGTLVSWLGQLLQNVLSSGLAIVNVLSLIFITPVVAFYLLRDWDRILAKLDSLLPRNQADIIREQCHEINGILSGFIRGQALVVLFLASFYATGLSIVGLDMGLIVGLSSGLLSFIPYLGTLSGLFVGVALGFAQTGDWTLPALVAGVFVVGNIIEGNFLTPKLVGDRVGLHPVWIIFALLSGATLFGFLGILLAVPVAAVIGVLSRFGVKRYLHSPLYRGSALE